jgi:catechol 2,3-dioxygenase-like lactoylglutathione lyase family enzyme
MDFFGMQVVWAPDPQNVYLSSGVDNLALHELPAEEPPLAEPQGQVLDHLGFIMASVGGVDRLYQRALEAGIRIVKLPKRHRDDSYSFYLADPDGNVVQVLYEPTISPMEFHSPNP